MNEVVVQLTGEIDIQVSADVREQLVTTAQEMDGGTLVVDLAEVSFLDSSGLSALIAALRASRSRGGAMRVVHPSDAVRRTLEITGMLEHFEVP